MRLNFTEQFEKALKAMPDDRAKRVKRALKNFIQNPETPGLRFHKLKGVDAYSLSSNKKDRIIMSKRVVAGVEHWTVEDVGAHDHVYRRLERRR